MKYLAACIALFLTPLFVEPTLAQDPNPTTLSAEQCTLHGDDRIVPNILGFSPTKAARIVRACGFAWDGATDVHTLSYEAIGTVGDQEPSGGTVKKKGTVVRGFISVGLYPPDFTGWDPKDAEKFYRDFRHGVNVVKERNPAKVGTVFKQKPKNAELGNSGPALTLYVSEGLYVDLPNLKDMDREDVERLLKKLKLKYKHGTGYDKYEKKKQTNCETIHYFPQVTTYFPSGRVYEGDTITVNTKKGSYDTFSNPGPNGEPCQ